MVDLYPPENGVRRWERGKGRLYAPVPNLIRLSVRYDSILSTLRISLALNLSCAPSREKKALFCEYSSIILVLFQLVRDVVTRQKSNLLQSKQFTRLNCNHWSIYTLKIYVCPSTIENGCIKQLQ